MTYYFRQAMQGFYLDWVNNWISTEAMADYYDLTDEEVKTLIKIGRGIHEQEVANGSHSQDN